MEKIEKWREMEMEVFLHYPGLKWVPVKKDGVTYPGYKGLLYIHHDCFEIELIRTKTGWTMIKSSEPLATDNINIMGQLNAGQYATAHAYLEAYVAHLRAIYPPPLAPVPLAAYRRVLHEHREFVNFHIGVEEAVLAADLSALRIRYADEKLRMHEFTIDVNLGGGGDGDSGGGVGNGKLFRLAHTALPPGCFDAVVEDDCLISLFDAHAGAVQALQVFFDVVDVLDRYAWVVDPPTPTYADVGRRIVLGAKLAVEITLEPHFATQLPLLRLFGPRSLTTPLEERFAVCYKDWCLGGDLMDELLKLFDIAVFPQRDSFQLSPCGLCKQLKNDFNDLPEVYCPNTACEDAFHVECLYKYLERTTWMLNTTMVGKCPACGLRIDCDPPKKRSLVAAKID